MGHLRVNKYLIPAFNGLGAPHWKMDLKAEIVGLTFGCDKNGQNAHNALTIGYRRLCQGKNSDHRIHGQSKISFKRANTEEHPASAALQPCCHISQGGGYHSPGY